MRQGQKGFTLVELVLAVGIIGAIVVTTAMAITTVMMNSERVTSQNPVLESVRNAGYWISRDVQMTGNVTLGSPNGFPLTLTIPVDDDPNHDYSIKYLFDGNKLERQRYDSSDNLTSETLIAQYVDTGNTTFAVVGANLYELTIRASTGGEVVTTSYRVCQRLISN